MGIISRRSWPDNAVPYEVADDIELDDVAREAVKLAVDEWNNRTPVRLIPRISQQHYAVFTKHTEACATAVGYQENGPQLIRCNLDGSSFGAVAIMHEIGHAVGLYHEQQRPDRSHYVNVSTGGVNYDIPDASQYYVFGNYDCNSIMHYRAIAGRISANRCSSIGGARNLTAGDIAAVSDWNHTVDFAEGTSSGASLVEFGGLLQVVVRMNDNELVHWFRTEQSEWIRTASFAAGSSSAPSLMQARDGLMQVAVCKGDQVSHWFRDPNQQWIHTKHHDDNCSGRPSLFQDNDGLLQIVSNKGGNKLAHYLRSENDEWYRSPDLYDGKGPSEPCVIQSSDGNLQAVVRIGSKLSHSYRTV